MKIERKKGLSGFTIVEVLVVIGIIAVLTAVIFPAISEIKAKNRDAEKVADIAAIQLALSFYYNQYATYPDDIYSSSLVPKFLTAESLKSPNGDVYEYVPLKLGSGDKCTYYHLGVELELPSAQIDAVDVFSSVDTNDDDKLDNDSGYSYCGDYPGNGIDGNNDLMYHVRP